MKKRHTITEKLISKINLLHPGIYHINIYLFTISIICSKENGKDDTERVSACLISFRSHIIYNPKKIGILKMRRWRMLWKSLESIISPDHWSILHMNPDIEWELIDKKIPSSIMYQLITVLNTLVPLQINIKKIIAWTIWNLMDYLFSFYLYSYYWSRFQIN